VVVQVALVEEAKAAAPAPRLLVHTVHGAVAERELVIMDNPEIALALHRITQLLIMLERVVIRVAALGAGLVGNTMVLRVLAGVVAVVGSVPALPVLKKVRVVAVAVAEVTRATPAALAIPEARLIQQLFLAQL
jgi:hypothetical protein